MKIFWFIDVTPRQHLPQCAGMFLPLNGKRLNRILRIHYRRAKLPVADSGGKQSWLKITFWAANLPATSPLNAIFPLGRHGNEVTIGKRSWNKGLKQQNTDSVLYLVDLLWKNMREPLFHLPACPSGESPLIATHPYTQLLPYSQWRFPIIDCLYLFMKA